MTASAGYAGYAHSYGVYCTHCGAWVPSGSFHSCTGPTTANCFPAASFASGQTYTWEQTFDVEIVRELKAIRTLVEKVVKLLEENGN